MKTEYAKTGYSRLPRATFQDGMWQAYYNIDPRYWMYYVDDTPLDERLADHRFRVTVVGREVIDGSHCAVVQAAMDAGAHGVLRLRCWVDLDHQYIIRKTEEDTLLPVPGGGTLDQVFLRSSVPSLLQANGFWYCAAFTSVTSLPLSPKGSEVAWFTKVSAEVTEIPAKVPWVSGSCTMRWPAGTKVHDYPTGKTFLVQRNGSLEAQK